MQELEDFIEQVRIVKLAETSPSPRLVDDGMQRLRQLVRCQMVEIEDDGGAAAGQTSEVIGLIGEQRDSDQWHSVIHRLIQTVGATVRYKCARLRVT